MPGVGFLDGFAFETLVAPCDSGDFLRDHWNRKPLLEQRRLPEFYKGLLSIRDIDRVLAMSSHNGAAQHENSLDIDAALRRLEHGAALVLEDAQHQLASLALVCRSVQAELGFRCSMSVEVTMPSNKPHPHEAVSTNTFVLQLAGRRDWRTDGDGLPEDFVLEAGDLLYLPPGCVCQHRSTGDESVTAFLTAMPPRWVDMTGNRALQDDVSMPAALAESLPPGWIHRSRAELVSELSRRWRQAEDVNSVELAVAQMIRTEIRAFPLDLRGRLIETLRPRRIGDDTVFSARHDLLWTIEPNGVASRLIAGPLTVDVRKEMTDAVAFCLKELRYTVGSMPGDQSPLDRRTLLDVLMRNVLIHRISA